MSIAAHHGTRRRAPPPTGGDCWARVVSHRQTVTFGLVGDLGCSTTMSSPPTVSRVPVRIRLAVLVGLSLGACGSGTESVTGRSSLAFDVDRADVTMPELRVVRSQADARSIEVLADIDEAARDSELPTEVRFPFEYGGRASTAAASSPG